MTYVNLKKNNRNYKQNVIRKNCFIAFVVLMFALVIIAPFMTEKVSVDNEQTQDIVENTVIDDFVSELK